MVAELLKYCIVEPEVPGSFPSTQFPCENLVCMLVLMLVLLEILYTILPWYLTIRAKFSLHRILPVQIMPFPHFDPSGIALHRPPSHNIMHHRTLHVQR